MPIDLPQQNLLPRRTIGTFFRSLFAGPTALVTIAVVIILLAGGAVAWNYYHAPRKTTTDTNAPPFQKLLIGEAQAQEHFALAPSESDSLGIATTTQFRLTSVTDVSCDDVAASLAITPETPVAVKTASARACDIVPKEALATGALYHIALGATVQTEAGESRQVFKWAYQTKETLAVVGMLPHDKATGVPIDTGIEVTFNTDRAKDVEKYFSITPEIKGRFEQHRRVWSFVPEERLAAGTLYTVTIDSGIPVQDSSVLLEQPVVARFETASDADTSSPYFPPLESAFTAVQPDEPPVIDFGYQTPPSNLVATVYAFESADALMERFAEVDATPTWAYYARQHATISTDGLTKIGDFPLAVQANAATFPSGFERGYYLLSLAVGKKTFQTPLVVSDLGASLTLTTNNSVLWLYDLKTNEPLEDATVKGSLDDARTTSDSRGIAQLKTPAALLPEGGDLSISRAYFSVTANDGRQTLVPAVPQTSGVFYGRSGPSGISKQSDDYWSYVWTDRTLYRPTDTLNIWGVLKHREHPQTEQVTFEVWTWNLVDANGDYVPVAGGAAQTDAYGSFQASVPLTALTPGYYTLSTKTNGRTVANRSFEVQTYTKPAFQISATTDRSSVIDGESVRYDIKTQFFDGTPAPKISLRYAAWGQAGEPGTELTTDDLGAASFTRTLKLSDESRHSPTYETLMFFPADGAEGDVAATTTVIVYPSSVTFQPTYIIENDTATINLKLVEVDRDAPVTSERVSDYENLGGALVGSGVPNAPIEGTVYEIITEKNKQGTRYDFLEKKVVDVYTYSSHNEKREDFKGVTDETGAFTHAFSMKGDAYLVDIAAQDAQERKVVRSLYLYRSGVMSGSQEGASYTLRDEKNAVMQATGAPVSYHIGDSTSIQFLQNGALAPDEGTFLYLKLQNGVRDVAVSKNASLPVTFETDDAPNVYYAGVWFHGGTFAAPQNIWDLPKLAFDEQSRALTVSVTPEQPSYAPGATAKLAVHVTDADGTPVRAKVNLSIIDEALSVIEWGNPPVPLESLYADVASGLLQSYVSHRSLSLESGAEGGGGGGGERNYFKDVAYFDTVETNNKGDASTTFLLPDNITSWRITAQAVTQDLFAGDVIVALPVTKPMFGVLTMAEEYVRGDQPVFVGYGYGTALAADDRVHMTFEIPDFGVKEVRDADAFSAERFSVQNLALGTHEVKFTVAHAKGNDTLVRTFTVLPSRLTKTTSTYADVAEGMTFTAPSDTRSTLVFTDTGRGRVLTTLESLQWSWGKRLDRSLAAIIAADAIKLLAADADAPRADITVAGYQQQDGGISQFTYGDSELRLSAFAAARSDLFDSARLEQYLGVELTEKNASLEQIGFALLGMADLGAPVLPDLESYLALDGITDEHRLIAALAYVSLGANDHAYTIASTLLSTYGETQEPYVRLTLGSSDDDKILHTAEFSILAEELKLNVRSGLNEYLSANFPKDTITNLERSLAMTAAVGRLDDVDASFRYRLNSVEQTVDLKDHRTYPISLTADELSAFSVLSVDGPVGVTQFTLTPADVETEPHDARLSINRTYALYGSNANRPLRTGDIVKITLTPKTNGVIDEGLLAVDELPSGLVLIAKPWSRGIAFDQDQGYPIEVNGQRVTFATGGKKAFFYYARVLIPGAFAAEPALLQGEQSRGVITYSGAQTLEIQ